MFEIKEKENSNNGVKLPMTMPLAVTLTQRMQRTDPGKQGMVTMQPVRKIQFKSTPVLIMIRPKGTMPRVTPMMHQFLNRTMMSCK